MGLWLEHRDEKGQLIDRACFQGGVVVMSNLTEFFDGMDAGVSPTFTIKDAIALAKLSAYLPVEKRDWALRVESDD